MGASCAHLGCCGPRPRRLDGRDSACVDPEPPPARNTPLCAQEREADSEEELVSELNDRKGAGEASSVAAEEDDYNTAFHLVKSNTFLEFKPAAAERRRSKSVPPNVKLLSETEAEEAPEEDVEKGRWPHHARDYPCEPPPLIYCMVQGCAEARRLMIWANVPEPTHCCCGNTCSKCCSLWNNDWRWSSMAHYPAGRLPGYASDCKSLEVPDDLQEDHLCEWDLPPWEAARCEVPAVDGRDLA